jgi:small nuclear ribonucleoprotein (snRNP)-like protein
MGVRDWDIVTSYVDSVTTTLKTVTFPKVQEQIKVKNQGNANLTYTIGSQSGTLTPGQSITINEDISSFTIQAASGIQAFELRAKEKGTEQTETETDVMTALADMTKRGFVTYSQFGAKLNGIDDDTQSIIDAHTFANSYGIPVKQNTGTIRLLNTVVVKTDTDLSGATLVLNDEMNGKSLWKIETDNPFQTITDYVQSELVSGAYKIPSLSTHKNSLIKITSNVLFGYRGGSGGTAGYDEESFLHTRNGFIIGGKLQRDFISGTLVVKTKKINDNAIHFKMPKVKWNFSNYLYTCRVIDCYRSNTTVSDVFLEVTNDNSLNNLANDSSFKGSLMSFTDCVNIKLENVTSETITPMGSTVSGYIYDFTHVVNVHIRNSNVINGWGAFATAFIKKLTIENSNLNRVDCHRGTGDISIKNTHFIGGWGVLLGWGKGKVMLEGCTTENIRGLDSYQSDAVVNLRNDWGGVFEGEIHINNHKVINRENVPMNVVKITESWAGTQNPLPIKLPSIVVNNLLVENSFDVFIRGLNISLPNFSGESRQLELPKLIRFENVEINNESDNAFFSLWTMGTIPTIVSTSKSKIILKYINSKPYSKYVNGFTATELSNVGAYIYNKMILDITDSFTGTEPRYTAIIDHCAGGVRTAALVDLTINNSKISALNLGDNTLTKAVKINDSDIYPYCNGGATNTYFPVVNAEYRNNTIYGMKKDGVYLPLNVLYLSDLKFLQSNYMVGTLADVNTLLYFINSSDLGYGNTASRPTTNYVGRRYFDTTLGKPVWWNGSAWKDATGTTA